MENEKLSGLYPALYKLRNVWRWGIVNMPRRQSVAEHCYLTWVIGADLYDNFTVEPTTLERAAVHRKLLTHDVEEALLGDLPSPIKRALESESRGILGRASAHVFGLQGWTPVVDNHWTSALVHFADLAEACLFAYENRAPSSLVGGMEGRLDAMCDEYERLHGSRFQWKKARLYVEGLLHDAD